MSSRGHPLEGMLETLLEKTLHVIVVEAVVDELPQAAASNDVQLTQRSELVRYRGLAHTDERGQIRRTELVQRKRMNDTNPRGIAEDLERLRQEPGLFYGQNLPFDIRDHHD